MIGNFQTSKSFNIREREYRCLWQVIKIACKSIICWDRVLVLQKNNLPGRGLTKFEKHWFRGDDVEWNICVTCCVLLNQSEDFLNRLRIFWNQILYLTHCPGSFTLHASHEVRAHFHTTDNLKKKMFLMLTCQHRKHDDGLWTNWKQQSQNLMRF
jgi:hypothetical protein